MEKLSGFFSPKILGAIALVAALGGGGYFLATRQPTQEAAPHVPTMKVNSVPDGAFVYVDGRAFGQTPADVSDLELGQKYMLRISKTGFKTLRQEVMMNDGASLTLTLEPE